jgi:hypothetical protein
MVDEGGSPASIDDAFDEDRASPLPEVDLPDLEFWPQLEFDPELMHNIDWIEHSRGSLHPHAQRDTGNTQHDAQHDLENHLIAEKSLPDDGNGVGPGNGSFESQMPDVTPVRNPTCLLAAIQFERCLSSP